MSPGRGEIRPAAVRMALGFQVLGGLGALAALIAVAVVERL
ncbi:hypothetical protein [Streptomyces sp. AF1A]